MEKKNFVSLVVQCGRCRTVWLGDVYVYAAGMECF